MRALPWAAAVTLGVIAWAWVLLMMPLRRAPVAPTGLLTRLQAGDTSVDFRLLRLSATTNVVPTPPAARIRAWRHNTLTALERGETATARRELQAWLSEDYLNPFAHLGARELAVREGRQADADFHARVLEGLYDSICRVGEGLSPERPCAVRTSDEIQYYLARHRFEIGDMREAVCGKSPCLAFEVRAPDGPMLVDLYFDIARLQGPVP